MTQIVLFLVAIAIGCGLRVVYFLCSFLAKSTKMKAMPFVMDTVFSILAFAVFLPFVIFLADGKTDVFLIVGLVAGLTLGSIPFAAFTKKTDKNPQAISVRKKEP